MSNVEHRLEKRKMEQGSSLLVEACTKHKEGDIEAAEELYKQVVLESPNETHAWRNLGALLRQQGKVSEARHCTEQALKLDPDDASLWGNYGNVLRDQGALENSCTAFREGLKRSTNSIGLLQGLAISLNKCKNYRWLLPYYLMSI